MSREQTHTQIPTELEHLRTRVYTLEVVEGPDAGLRLQTQARVVRIGTAPECELELNDPTTSRLHARIELDQSGHRLLDEHSKNGTFVNELRVRDAVIMSGARIQIGGNVIAFELGDEEISIALSKSDRFGRLLGGSAAMREIFAILERISPTDTTILVEGESGTGKELIAEAVHQSSTRIRGPLVVFDCSAVAPNLIESELFGHVKGAFTGASENRAGAFEQAEGGTLFIDELGELPYELQAKLLRALESREVRRVGSNQATKVNARIIAATNRNLHKEVELGQFRQDLYYRLAVIRLVLPPLRRRPEDIPLLVRHFLNELDVSDSVQIGYDTILKLQQHRWPGNVRELRNFVERAALLATGDRIETKHLVPPSFGDTHTDGDDDALSLGAFADDLPFKDAKARLIERFERAYWGRLLSRTKGNVSAAARIAGIHRKSAEYLLKKLDLNGAD